MHRLILKRVTAATLLALTLWSPASAHCIVGNRFFPATLNVDDPCVNDELSIPTIAAFKNGDVPSADELDISGDYSKTITENFGVSLGETWVHLDVPGGGTHAGFDNLATSFQIPVPYGCKRRASHVRITRCGLGWNRKQLHRR